MEKLFILTVHAGNGLFYCPVFALNITEAHYKVRDRFPNAGFIEGHYEFERKDIVGLECEVCGGKGEIDEGEEPYEVKMSPCPYCSKP